MTTAPTVLVIGGASLDVLHLADGSTLHSAGGAGLYTALAAARAGAAVTMYAPRPREMPAALAPALDYLDWVGPLVALDDLPRFEIRHFGGGRAELSNARWGAEGQLSPENLPPALSDTDWDAMIVCPLREPARQQAFVRDFRGRATFRAATTFAKAAGGSPALVRQTALDADVFFCNANEAGLLFGDPAHATSRAGQLMFVTDGERGATVVQGDHRTPVAGVRVGHELDPTGAGDVFAGTTLALLARGMHPVWAAQRAVEAAAAQVTAIGPGGLFASRHLPAGADDPRAAVDDDQVTRMAGLLRTLPTVTPFDFTGPDFPPVDDPHAVDWFFATVLHQFGFWRVRGGAYSAPVVVDGRKGSDYLWHRFRQIHAAQPGRLSPQYRATAPPEELASAIGDGDDDADKAALHTTLSRDYGRTLLAMGRTPVDLLAEANTCDAPLRRLLTLLDGVGGYREDPLRKKSVLLAIILNQRPERFLRIGMDEAVPPIIDYHLQRVCLRTGLVRIGDDDLRQRVAARTLVSPGEEWAIRLAAYRAVEAVQRVSGLDMGAIDWAFFQARRFCPEMQPPDCAACAFAPACAQDTALFQPVIRTTYY